jgi:hypothetical protein
MGHATRHKAKIAIRVRQIVAALRGKPVPMIDALRSILVEMVCAKQRVTKTAEPARQIVDAPQDRLVKTTLVWR